VSIGYESVVGYQDINSQPASCKDLYLVGSRSSGYYSIKGNNAFGNKIQTVYCDFSLSSNDEGGLKMVIFI